MLKQSWMFRFALCVNPTMGFFQRLEPVPDSDRNWFKQPGGKDEHIKQLAVMLALCFRSGKEY